MKGEGGRISNLPILYPQVANRAWRTRERSIHIEYEEQMWVMTGSAGNPSGQHEDEPVQFVDGVPMSMIRIERVAKMLWNVRQKAFVSIKRISQCRVPISEVNRMGEWVRPGSSKKKP